MNFEDYQNTMTYPDRPSKPGLIPGRKAATPEDYRKLADALEAYEKDMSDFRIAQAKYNTETSRLEEQFRKDALEDVGLTGHPKADKAYSFAWEHGHSSGLGEVYQWLDDIADILKD